MRLSASERIFSASIPSLGYTALPTLSDRISSLQTSFPACWARLHLFCLARGSFWRESRSDDHEFVASHARYIIVLTAGFLEGLRKQPQYAVAFQVSKAVVDLLEAVQIGDHHGQGVVVAFAARQFPIELQEQRARIRKTSEVIGNRRTLRLLVLHRVLDGERHLGTYSQQNAEVVGGKEVFFRVVQSDHADHTLHALERNGERRRQRAVLRSIVQITGLNRRIAIQDRLAVLRDPPRQSLSNRNAQRGKQPEVVAIHILRHKFRTLADVDGNRIVGNRPPQLHRKHRERFAQAERSSQILAKLEKGLCFLARRRDRTQKTALRQLPPPLRLEPGVRPDGRLSVCVLVFDFHFRGQFLLAQIVGALVD